MPLTNGLHIDLFDTKDTLTDILSITNSNFQQIREMFILLGQSDNTSDLQSIISHLDSIEQRLSDIERRCGSCACCNGGETGGSSTQQENGGNSGVLIEQIPSSQIAVTQQNNNVNSGVVVAEH